MNTFEPGTLVRCREREWVVLPSDTPEVMRLRPLGGQEYEQIGIYLPLSRALGTDQITPAIFPAPDPDGAGDYISARLLRDASRLTFRSGAGPFRSLGRLNVRPRPFQLVPLLMALRLDPVRLLIADDVGIGKTIEAGLIAREMLDRGEIRRMAVICPPHLCEQWQRELADKFGIEAEVVRSGTLARLEKNLPPGDKTIYEHYPALVVSIDFVKSDTRKDSFIRGCPEFVIVDEAHTATRSGGKGSTTQQRHELLRELADNPKRHLLLLTATPHSGIEDAFLSLLELLKPDFARLNLNALSEGARREMAQHFVQRRRVDVQQWLGKDDLTPFPTRQSLEESYKLNSSIEYQKLFLDIYDFAYGIFSGTVGNQGRTAWHTRIRHWTALALLRCVLSSPAAAEATLRVRASKVAGNFPEQELTVAEENSEFLGQFVFDYSQQEVAQDFEPLTLLDEGEALLDQNERAKLQRFIGRATRLRGEADPKLLHALGRLTGLVQAGFQPIVYCRYIATAEYLAEELKKRMAKQFPDLQIVAITGKSSEEEREQRIAELSSNPRRLLVATDCLSEGINLQNAFNAVVHYDLPWNPNRLEQREGRVDRYGQPSPVVRTLLFYAGDNIIEKAVMDVLIRKAREIHRTLGISVPLPADSESVVEAVVRTIFQEQPRPQQLTLFESDRQTNFNELGPDGFDLQALNASWDEALEREKVSRTRFAQHAIKPEEVAQELYESDAALGSPLTVLEFVRSACERLNNPLKLEEKHAVSARAIWRLTLHGLPEPVRERLTGIFKPKKNAGGEVLITFDTPVQEGVYLVNRLHPLTEGLADYMLSAALDSQTGTTAFAPAARCGVVRTTEVSRRTTLVMLRLRHLITTQDKPVPLLSEELLVAAFEGRPDTAITWLAEKEALRLLNEVLPAGNVSAAEAQERLKDTLGWLPAMSAEFDRLAERRAATLLESHRRVRQVTRTGRVSVRPQLPVDVLGLYVYLPVPKGLAAKS